MAKTGLGEVKFHEMSAQAGNGRITGDAEYAWGLESRASGQLRFLGADLKAVLTETADFSSVSGRANGRFEFRGENVRDVDDLSGTLAVDFTQPSTLDTPFFRPLAPYISPGQSVTGFTRGDLLAHLSGGIFRIQRLTLEGAIRSRICGRQCQRGGPTRSGGCRANRSTWSKLESHAGRRIHASRHWPHPGGDGRPAQQRAFESGRATSGRRHNS